MSQDSTLVSRLENEISKLSGCFKISTLYSLFPEEKESTIRGRIYEQMISKGVVEKVERGIYRFKSSSGIEGVILQGDARELKQIEDSCIDLMIADHPYPIQKGTNRNYNSTYIESTFKYQLDDFKQKFRVLKEGSFLVEFLPEMKETNVEYIMDIIKMANEAGFKFYAKVPWYKAELRDGKIVDGSAFVGRKAVLEEVYFFTKGNPRKLRYRKQGESVRLEQGAKSMLPAVFMEPVSIPKNRIHKAEKPKRLLEYIIECCTEKAEVVLDQFSGSFNAFWSALGLERNAIAIEISEEFIDKNIVNKKTA